MASSAPWLDKVYLIYFALHIPIMFFVDLVPFYPQSLWFPESAPFHFLQELRAWYLATHGDQFFRAPPAVPPNFFLAFTFLELVFHLPVSIWAARRLAAASFGSVPLDGPAELLLLVYGLETVLTTGVCMYEAYTWDAALVTREQKVMLLTAMYGSYFVIAAILTVDMYVRVLRRFDAAGASFSSGAAKKLQ